MWPSSEINWTNPNTKLTANFTVKDACWLPRASLLYKPKPDEQVNLLKTCALMEKVRTLVKGPVLVHCMIRPIAYNAVVGGKKGSAHIAGLACDFSVPGVDCDIVRQLILPDLERWEARMEDNPGSDWIHLDLAPLRVMGSRFFKP